MQCLYGRAGDKIGSCDFHRQSLRTTRMTDAYRGSLKMIMVTIKKVRTTWVAVIYKGRVLGPPGCCGAYMCRLRTNRFSVMVTVVG